MPRRKWKTLILCWGNVGNRNQKINQILNFFKDETALGRFFADEMP